MKFKNILTKQFLIEQYIKNKKSSVTIAKEIGCGKTTLRIYMEKYNIPFRSLKESLTLVKEKLGKINKGKKFNKKHKKRLSISMQEYRRTEWEAIKDRTIYGWKKYKKFRLKILKRDNYKCKICNKKANTIHHIKSGKKYPELYWKKTNIISVCQSCHTKIDNPQNPKINTQIKQIINLKKSLKKLEKKIVKYKKLSIIDDLTGLYNHRILHRDLAKYLYDLKRYKINHLIILLDIDNFKKINDTKGHLEGDRVLKKVAKILKQHTRKGDKIYRYYNGDEFVIISKYCNKIENIIKRIRKKLLKNNIKVSIGYSLLCKNVLDIADKKMYEDKRRK